MRLGVIQVIPPADLIRAAERVTISAEHGPVPAGVAIRFAREAAVMARELIALKSGDAPKALDAEEATDMRRVLEARTLQVDTLRRRLGRVEGAARSVLSQGASLDLLASALAESDDDWRDLLPERTAP